MDEQNNNGQPVRTEAQMRTEWEAERNAQEQARQREADLTARETALAEQETTAKWNARLPKIKDAYVAKGGKLGKDDADFKAWSTNHKDALLESDEDKIGSVVIGSYKEYGVYFNLDENGQGITPSQEFNAGVKTEVKKGEHKFRRVPGTTTRVG